MPHKHTRKSDNDDKHFNLAPNARAKPLPAFEAKTNSGKKDERKRKRSSSQKYKEDDTPRAFARLMQHTAGRPRRSGLDNGEPKQRSRKGDGAAAQPNATKGAPTVVDQKESLRILPGESMADFSARVNQALPVSGLAQKGKQIEGVRERQTKTEKRLKKMYAEWREEDARRKAKLEEAQEQQEEEADEQAAEYGGQTIDFPPSRKAKRRRLIGEVADKEDTDPWAVLKSRRDRPKGLHDVVQAPPTMTVVPKEKLKVANVPTVAGSLRRREELSEARREVIERYRGLMRKNDI